MKSLILLVVLLLSGCQYSTNVKSRAKVSTRNDIAIRLLACTFQAKYIEQNADGSELYLVKWDCH